MYPHFQFQFPIVALCTSLQLNYTNAMTFFAELLPWDIYVTVVLTVQKIAKFLSIIYLGEKRLDEFRFLTTDFLNSNLITVPLDVQNTELLYPGSDTGTQMTVASLACCIHINHTCKGLDPCRKVIQRVLYRCSR